MNKKGDFNQYIIYIAIGILLLLFVLFPVLKRIIETVGGWGLG